MFSEWTGSRGPTSGATALLWLGCCTDDSHRLMPGAPRGGTGPARCCPGASRRSSDGESSGSMAAAVGCRIGRDGNREMASSADTILKILKQANWHSLEVQMAGSG